MKSLFVKALVIVAISMTAACSKKAEMPPPPPPVVEPVPLPPLTNPADVKAMQKKMNMKGARLRADGQMQCGRKALVPQRVLYPQIVHSCMTPSR